MYSLLLLLVAPATALRGAPLRATTRLDYDHLYHIGSPVDVFKHCVLTALLRRCTEKASPLTYAETHAGRGLYPFDSEEASMLAEFEDGYHKLRARAEEVLHQVGLGDRMDHRTNELSGGQRQRVAVGRALVMKPSIVLADEPTGNLDTATSQEVMELFGDIQKAGNTVILVTHEEDIAAYAHRTVRLRDGRVESDA